MNTEVGCHVFLQGDIPDPGIEPISLMSPVLAGRFFAISDTWEAQVYTHPCANHLYGKTYEKTIQSRK